MCCGMIVRGSGGRGKFADADLLGMPLRATISQKSLLTGGVELKREKKKITTKQKYVYPSNTLS